jgi:hypothetical protein
MVRVAEEHPSVVIVGAYGIKGRNVEWVGLPYPSTVVAGRVPCRLRLMSGVDVFGAATAVLYRAELVRSRDPFFDEANFHADSRVCLEALANRDYGFVHQILTFRRSDDDGSMGAVSEEFKTINFAILGDLVACGPLYLSEAELRRRVREHLHEYYRFLGSQVFRHRSRQFWRLHEEKLLAAGYPLRMGSLIAGTIGYISSVVLNPKMSVEKVIRLWRESVRQRSDDGISADGT